MQLIRVTHRRCGDYDANTFVLAPDKWSRKDAREAIDRAQKAYLEGFAIAVKQSPAPNDWRPYGKPNYETQPDKTVAQIKAEWDAKADAFHAWEAEQRKTRSTFEGFLKAEGFTLLWDDDAAHEFEVDWSHRHGQRLAYGDDKTDSMPTPAVFAGVEEPDDDWFG